ncbi:ABC transporter ATP-binding protein [Flammeovirga kamogawensis]|uniref:ABC transporter ATP-binding protein n=1 Tax=Flammeovirga kamogawensis TaxID=373891 RepID=A0ABX8H295_9BACT|nr:ABC transporter ATP-binding protein [Flammeovirga kamogawensis]MBB6463662.1 putative ABC transport system ATP-binding protein [Flammeovirga kamogawensis]QWG09275.1 ABC transporter ATP-binding protein [Flammeovirga kamogawensis]TRX64799.1 ABC transporter ATP-binding protein [Flammeovirga kamogawensis]
MIILDGVYKSYQTNDIKNEVLKNISLKVGRSEFVAIMGSSGSGKSTLLNIIGLLDNLDSGYLSLNGLECMDLNETEKAKLRNELMGFVFQSFHLLPHKTVLKNIELALFYQKVKSKERTLKAKDVLQKVGLLEKADSLPNELSGGQKQRVAIARALVTNPPIIFADEPTGALDSKTSHEIMNLLKGINTSGKTILMITHDKTIAGYADKIIHLADGHILI